MSFLPNLPPSVLVKQNDDESKQKYTKEDFKKMKELEEARKLAQVPAMKDEHGNDINPHIPQYIMQAPWFYNSVTPTLRHQRLDQKKEDTMGLSQIIAAQKNKIEKNEVVVKSFRKGCCENCGGAGHKRSECCEKPRARLAKYSSKPMVVVDIKTNNSDVSHLGYDAKRDRYNNYDALEHAEVVDRFYQKEELRKQAKARHLEEQLKSCDDETKKKLFEKVDEDESRTGEDVDMPGQKFDAKQRQSIRNLRLREDTSKYLLNLDPDSAYYDPKTRAMRGNPFENTGKSVDEVPFAGDNFIRLEDEAKEMLNSQVFVWEMAEHGVNLHLQADPTRVELLARQIEQGSKTVKSKINQEILDTYGGEEFLQPPPAELIYGQSESYFEYDSSGRQIKGPKRPNVLSRYEEDVFRNNHSSVWGSYWKNGHWGYKCCHSLEKVSYCLGEAGIKLESDSKVQQISDQEDTEKLEDSKPEQEEAIAQPIKKRKTDEQRSSRKKHKRRKQSSSSSSSSSSNSSESAESESSNNHEKEIQKALQRERNRLKEIEKYGSYSERNQPYNLNYSECLTEAEKEAYHRLKSLKDDPMNKFL